MRLARSSAFSRHQKVESVLAIFTHTPKSEHVKSFSYDDHRQVLSVTFQSDRAPAPKIYSHAGVPLSVFHSFLEWSKNGHSAGSYYHRFLKRYPRTENPVQ